MLESYLIITRIFSKLLKSLFAQLTMFYFILKICIFKPFFLHIKHFSGCEFCLLSQLYINLHFKNFIDHQRSISIQNLPCYRGSGRQHEVRIFLDIPKGGNKRLTQMFSALDCVLYVSMQRDFVQGEYDVHSGLFEGWHVSVFIVSSRGLGMESEVKFKISLFR